MSISKDVWRQSALEKYSMRQYAMEALLSAAGERILLSLLYRTEEEESTAFLVQYKILWG
jgi:hypothetical protein